MIRLDHINIHAEDLEAARDFLLAVLPLEQGFRPPFDFKGYWLYLDGKPIIQPNRNPLLGRFAGADGLKTGHTSEAGYCFLGSAKRDGRRLIMVVAGMPSEKARREEAERLMNWGFASGGSPATARNGSGTRSKGGAGATTAR